MAKKETEKKEVAVADIDIKKKVAGAVKAVEELVITSAEEMSEAGALQVNVKQFQKYIVQEKKKQLDPANETVKAIKAFWLPFETQIEDALSKISRTMIVYHDKVEAERKRKEESIINRAEKGQIKEETAVNKLEELGGEKKTVAAGAGSVTFTKIKKVRFANPTKLGVDDVMTLVNGGYLVWDEVKGRRDALGGGLTIGVEIYEETNTNTRS